MASILGACPCLPLSPLPFPETCHAVPGLCPVAHVASPPAVSFLHCPLPPAVLSSPHSALGHGLQAGLPGGKDEAPLSWAPTAPGPLVRQQRPRGGGPPRPSELRGSSCLLVRKLRLLDTFGFHLNSMV